MRALTPKKSRPGTKRQRGVALLIAIISITLLTLTALEIVLGIDNIIFISILVGRLPEQQRNLARRLGLGLAMVLRIALLLSLTGIYSVAPRPRGTRSSASSGIWRKRSRARKTRCCTGRPRRVPPPAP